MGQKMQQNVTAAKNKIENLFWAQKLGQICGLGQKYNNNDVVKVGVINREEG